MKRQILIVTALFFLSLVVPEGVFADAEGDLFSAAVEEIFDTYSSTNMKKDAEGWIALWDEEGIKMVPDLPSIYGKSAIGEFKHKKSQIPDEMDMSIKVEDAQIAGDFGFAHGTYFVSVTPKGGGAVKSKEGKFLTIFKKQADGSWKIYRDSVSPNPAPK
ncbi:YybH family protein [Thermodesulfobacteriota bacterium]